MAIEWEDITPEEIVAGDKLMTIRGAGAGATPRLITAGTAAVRNVGTGSGNIPVLGSDGKLSADRLPASALTPLRQPAASFADSFVLEAGRIGYETDTHKIKMGDGATVWSSLSYTAGSGAGGVSSWDDLEDIPDPLSAIGALTAAADRYVYYTSSSAAALGTITSNARSLLAAADYAAMKVLLDLEIGTDVQAYNANLGAFAGLTLIADRLPYANGTGTLALATFSAFARTLLDDADAAAVRTTIGFSDAIDADWSDPVDALAGWDDAGAKASVPMAAAPEATCYHVVTGALAGMADQGAALDRWDTGAQTITPASGDVTWLWPLDPATSEESPEVALAEANRPSNAEVSLVNATSDGGVYRLTVPEPDDEDVLAGLERRSIGFRLVNDDPSATFTIELAAPAVGYLTPRWRGALDDFNLAPSEEGHVWGRIRAGEIDFDQIIRAAAWATIELVAGSAVQGSGNTRTIPNVLAGDLVMACAVRPGGQAITTPTGRGWVEFTGTNFSTGRLLGTGRAAKMVYAFATVDGDFNTGAFTSGDITLGMAFRNVGSVGQIVGTTDLISPNVQTSLAYPALTPPLAPSAHVAGFTVRMDAVAMASGVAPSGATAHATRNATVNGGTGVTGWSEGPVTTHAPAALTQDAMDWQSGAIELIPLEIS